MDGGDQELNRRSFLKAAPTAAASLAGCGPIARLSGRSDYQPVFFDAHEWAFITAAVARLIPEGEEGPSGLDANVPAFIDRQMALPYGHGAYWYMKGPFHPDAKPTLGYQMPYTPRDIYRRGIVLIDQVCGKIHSGAFSSLDPNKQDVVLQDVEQHRNGFEDKLAGVFFKLLLQNTKEGYFADPIHGSNKDLGSWKLINFPGARADFTDFIDKPGQPYPLGPVSIMGVRPPNT